jgi:hypothetical protein
VSAYGVFSAWCNHGVGPDQADLAEKHWCGCVCPPVEYYIIDNGQLVIRCDGCGVTWTHEDEWGME